MASWLTTNISGFCFARPNAQLLLLHSHPEWVHFTTISVALQRWQNVFSLSSYGASVWCRRQREFICICKQSVESRLTVSSFTLARAHSPIFYGFDTIIRIAFARGMEKVRRGTHNWGSLAGVATANALAANSFPTLDDLCEIFQLSILLVRKCSIGNDDVVPLGLVGVCVAFESNHNRPHKLKL